MSNNFPLDETEGHKNNELSNKEQDEIKHMDMPVTSDDATENHYFAQFAAADAEWHKKFQGKLLRKVDWRLIPLMIIMYLNNFMVRKFPVDENTCERSRPVCTKDLLY